MKKLATIAAILAAGCAIAGVPVKWTVETSRADTQEVPCYHGETLDMEVTFKNYGQDLYVPTNVDAQIFWQTNGMSAFYWRTNNVTVVSNKMYATFLPEMDPGTVSCKGFVGIPGQIYRASFVLRFKNSPGLEPKVLEWPYRELDFTKIEVKNAPYYLKNQVYTKDECENKIEEMGETCNAFTTNKIDQTLRNQAHVVWNNNAAVVGEEGSISLHKYNNYATWAGEVLTAKKLGLVDRKQTDEENYQLVTKNGGLSIGVETKPTFTNTLNGTDYEWYGNFKIENANIVNRKFPFEKGTNIYEFTYRSGTAGVIVDEIAYTGTNTWKGMALRRVGRGYVPIGEILASANEEPSELLFADIQQGLAVMYDVTIERRDKEIENYELAGSISTNKKQLVTADVVAKCLKDVETDPTISPWAKETTKPTYSAAEVGAYSAANGNTLATQVSTIGAHLNTEDARFVSTNYNSATKMPEAYVEVKQMNQTTGSNEWLRVWSEMTRWNKFVGTGFDWTSWGGFHAWRTNITEQIAQTSPKEYAFYDGVTGGIAPDGFFWIAQPRVAVCAGMGYQRYIDAGGTVWILESNGMVANVNGTTNGYFRISDEEGNTQFEIIKGDKQTVGATAYSMRSETVMGVVHRYVEYAVTNALTAPTARFCRNLSSPTWIADTEASCPCNVTWTPGVNSYTLEFWPKATEPQMFVKAEYDRGGETRIKNSVPTEMQYIILNGTKYQLVPKTVGGELVMGLVAE